MDPILLHTSNTTKFLLPLVIKDGYTYKDIQTNLIGAYISSVDFPEYNQDIIVVFNDDVRPACLNDNYIDNIANFDESREVFDFMFIYEIEDNQLEDYFSFINGEYSKLTTKTKDKILEFWEVDKKSFLYSILHKDTSNFTEMIERSKIKHNPWNNLYLSWIYAFKNKKELYKAPNLKEEMYGYNSEL